MHDDFASKLADVLTGYSQPIEPGQLVSIRATTAAMPLVEALYAAVLKRGGHVIFAPQFDNLNELFYMHANDDQLAYTPPRAWADADSVDVLFALLSSTNTRLLAEADPAKLAASQKAAYPVRERMNEREETGDFRWCVSAWPTVGLAQEAGMGLLAYTDFVYRACGLHRDDPIAYWQDMRARQTRIVEWLDQRQELKIEAPGIELSMKIAGRTWENCFGDENFPDGEVFTGPVEDSVNGHVEFSYPTIYMGSRVEGARLVFKDGVVVEASAAQGEETLQQQLNMDAGARRLGEFAIGTNYDITRFTGNTLFDEKIGGTLHMALGRAYPETGATNQSVIHWDMVHGMRQNATISADGEVFYRDGQFLID